MKRDRPANGLKVFATGNNNLVFERVSTLSPTIEKRRVKRKRNATRGKSSGTVKTSRLKISKG